MKNSEKIKALFFAQYYGQKVINKPYTGFPPSEKDFFTETGELMFVSCDRQRYYRFSALNNNSLGHPNEEYSTQPIQDGVLLLRSVDQITADEIRNLAIIFYGVDTDLSIHKYEYYTHVKVGISYFDINTDGETSLFNCESDSMGNELYFDAHAVMLAYQYLLRIGILLPFTYLDENNKPITIISDEIISLGWAKYQTNE